MSVPIAHIENEQRRGFFIEQEGKVVAEMTYSRVNDKLIIVDHTLVNDSLAGQGVARSLLDALVAWARTSSTKVLATCPYAIAQFNKDPSIADVRG